MPFDTSMYNQLDTSTPVKISQVLDPSRIEAARNEREDRRNRLADMAARRELQSIRLGQARQEAQGNPAAQADAARAREEKYMRGISQEIANNPENKDAILQRHAQIAPQFGINPSHVTWLAQDLSKAKTPADVQRIAYGHANPEAASKAMGQQLYGKQSAPEFSASAGGYVEPPSAQFPSGRVIKPEGMKGKETDVNWTTVDTEQGMVQVHPITGAIRKLGITKAGGAPKALTEGQAKATTYVSQMQSASNELDKLEQGGFAPESVSGQAAVKLAGGMTNIFAPAKAQQYKQSQEQWAESFLRAKTGAAATKEEVEMNRKTFFPQVGDSPEVMAQKRAMRKQAERDVAVMAGPGATQATQRESPTATYDPDKEARYQAWKAQQGAQ